MDDESVGLLDGERPYVGEQREVAVQMKASVEAQNVQQGTQVEHRQKAVQRESAGVGLIHNLGCKGLGRLESGSFRKSIQQRPG